MTKNRQSVIGLTVLVLSVVLVLLPDYIAPVCHGDHTMKCHHMALANKGVAVAMMFNGTLLLFIRNRDIARGVAVGGILLSVLAIANSAFFIGGCASPMMSCNTKNIPATYLVAGVLAAVQLYFVRKPGNQK